MRNNNLNFYGFEDSVYMNPKRYNVTVSSEDHIITIEKDGSLLADIKLAYEDGVLYLQGKNGEYFAEVELPHAGLTDLTKTVFDAKQKAILLTFATVDGKEVTLPMDVSDLIDIYEGGMGIEIDEIDERGKKKVNVKLSDNEDLLGFDEHNHLMLDKDKVADKHAVDALFGQLHKLHTEVHHVISHSAEADKYILETLNAKISGNTEALDSRIDDLFDEMTSGFSEFEEALSAETEARIDGDNELNNKIDELINDVIGDIDDKISGGAAPILDRLDDVENRLEALESGSTDMLDDLSVITETVDTLVEDVTDLSAFTEALSDEVKEMTSALEKEIKARIDGDNNLQDSIDAIDLKVDGAFIELKKEIKDREKGDKELLALIESLSGDTDERLDDVEDKLDDITSGLTEEIEDAVSALTKDLEDAISGLTEDIEELDEKLDEITDILSGAIETETDERIAADEKLQEGLDKIQLVKNSQLEYTFTNANGEETVINIPEDQFLKDVKLVEDDKLEFTFILEGEHETILVDISKYIDIYTVADDSEDFLTIDGYKISVNGVNKAIADAIEEEKKIRWQKDNAESKAREDADKELNAKISSLEISYSSAIADLKEKDAELEGKIASAKTELDGKLDSLQESYDAYTAATDETLGKLESGLTKVTEDIADKFEMDEKLNEQVQILKASADTLNGIVNDISGRYADIEQEILNAKAEVTDKLDEEVKRATTAEDALDNKISSLSAVVNSYVEDVETLSGRVATLEGTTIPNALNDANTYTDDKVKALSSDTFVQIDDLKEKTTANSSKIAVLENQNKLQEYQNNLLIEHIKKSDVELNNLETRIKALEEDVKYLKNLIPSFSHLEDENKDLKSAIDKLDNRLMMLETK